MKYRLVVCDIDGTITRHISSWQFLHEKMGQWDNHAEKYQRSFLAGEIDYEEFCRRDAAHWKGLEAERLRQLFQEIPYFPNVAPALRKLKEKGFRLAAVSTGIQFVLDRVQQELGFERVIGNFLNVSKGRLTGDVTIKVSHLEKGKALQTLTGEIGIPAEHTVVVGDSAGDVPMMKIAGYSIAFNALDPQVKNTANYTCRTEDFMEVCRKIISLNGMGSD
jgi:phosphoserine phosphatase